VYDHSMTTQTPLFDTHRTIERLIASGGFEKKQAEAIADALDTALTGGVSTKADMEKMELRLKIWVGWGLFVAVGVIGGIIAYATSLILSAPP